MKFMKPKYLALFIAAATSSAFAAAPGAPTIGYGNDKFAPWKWIRQPRL